MPGFQLLMRRASSIMPGFQLLMRRASSKYPGLHLLMPAKISEQLEAQLDEVAPDPGWLRCFHLHGLRRMFQRGQEELPGVGSNSSNSKERK